MKLLRNENADKRGKYAIVPLVKVANLTGQTKNSVRVALKKLQEANMLDFGDKEDGEFFVMTLRDMFAPAALRSYAKAVLEHAEKVKESDPKKSASLAEFGAEILGLFKQSMANKGRKLPD